MLRIDQPLSDPQLSNMIVLDDIEHQAIKARTTSSYPSSGWVPSVPRSVQFAPTEARNQRVLSGSPVNRQPQLRPPDPPSYGASISHHREHLGHRKRHKRRRRVFIVALAVVIEVVVSAYFFIPWFLQRHRTELLRYKLDHAFAVNKLDPHSQTSDNCTEWQKSSLHGNEVQRLRYRFPIKPSIMVAQAPPSPHHTFTGAASGALNIIMNEDEAEIDVVTDVVAKFQGSLARQTLSVCLRTSENKSILQFDPLFSGPQSPVLQVSMRLPQRISSAFNLTTHLSFLEHNFGELPITFDVVEAVSMHSSFNAKALSGRQIRVRSSSSEIKGMFKVREFIELATDFGPIDTDVVLGPNESGSTGFRLSSGNSPIKAHISLTATNQTQSGVPYSYNGVVQSSSGLVNLSLSQSFESPAAVLNLEGRTTFKPISLSMNRFYEGEFVVATREGSAIVVGASDHPQNAGDRLAVFDERAPERSSGWTGWSRRPSSPIRQGRIELSTEFEDAMLSFSP